MSAFLLSYSAHSVLGTARLFDRSVANSAQRPRRRVAPSVSGLNIAILKHHSYCEHWEHSSSAVSDSAAEHRGSQGRDPPPSLLFIAAAQSR